MIKHKYKSGLFKTNYIKATAMKLKDTPWKESYDQPR